MYICIYAYMYICIYVYMYICIWVNRVSPLLPSVFKYSICALFRDAVHVSEMLCTFPSSCARFTEVVHMSQKLCTFRNRPNNVCVQLYTH